jgi:hypothetical protein
MLEKKTLARSIASITIIIIIILICIFFIPCIMILLLLLLLLQAHFSTHSHFLSQVIPVASLVQVKGIIL